MVQPKPSATKTAAPVHPAAVPLPPVKPVSAPAVAVTPAAPVTLPKVAPVAIVTPKTLNTAVFFKSVRESVLFHGVVSQKQVDGMGGILDAFGKYSAHALHDHLAYEFATTYHETAQAMYPVEEWGKGHGHPYGIANRITHQVYYGRGEVQLTWIDNYTKFGKILGIDLVNHPEKELDPLIAAATMIMGMEQGLFTGRKLDDYITVRKTDFVSARRIINGTDKASMIAGYAILFSRAIKTAT